MLFNFYYPKLLHVAMAFVPGIVAAQEVVSDLFYKILKNPKTLSQVNDFNNYIFLAVKNQAITYLKKNSNKGVIDSLDSREDYLLPDSKTPLNSLISDELFRLVEKLVQELPPKRKVIFLLVKEEGKKYREVAEILDISVKTVELQMYHALKSLRKAVQEYLDAKDVKVKPITPHFLTNKFL